MRAIVKLLGLVLLLGALAAAAFVLDFAWNDSRMFYAAAGRGGLERDCRPLTIENLAGKGFSPADLTFDPRPTISVSVLPGTRTRTFADTFTFSDGPNGQRVDGSVVCTVTGRNVTVEVSVDSLPLRTT